MIRILFKVAIELFVIIYINEIDAIVWARVYEGFSRGNDEHESTLNQLLVEMDEYGTTSGLVLTCTNRPDILEKSLSRLGQFDYQTATDKLYIKDHIQVFQVYLRKLKMNCEPSFYSQIRAALSPRFNGGWSIHCKCLQWSLIFCKE